MRLIKVSDLIDVIDAVGRPNDIKSENMILSYVLRNCFVEDRNGTVSSLSALRIVQYFLNSAEDQKAAMELLDEDYRYVG